MIIAKRNQIKEMFQTNLKLLSPWLRESVLGIDEDELWKKVNVTYNAEGYPVCRYHDTEKFYITSQRPIQEAEQWCETISAQGAGAIFLYGSGFGYALFEIFARKQPHTLVVLFEENIYLFAAILYYFDLKPILETKKIAILVGNPQYFAKAFDKLFFSIIFANCTSPVVAFTALAQRNFKVQYLQIHQYVFSQLSLYVFYIGNDHLDNLIGFHNIVANLREILQNPYLSCLKDSYKDVPAFIVANGPSLDNNIQQLKNINGKGLIISTESAIVPLMKNGIKPDILTIIERTKYTYTYHFEDIEYPQEIALLSLALVDKQVYPSFPGAIIPIFRRIEAINDWINQHIGDGTSLHAGANVSHLALELAVYLGANPIVLVGQDYAYGPQGATHSKDAVYSQEKGKHTREVISSKPIIYVKGNDGSMIPSNQLWADFKRGLEGKVATHSSKTVYNATEGGARIEGTVNAMLAQIIEKYCKVPVAMEVHELIARHKTQIVLEDRSKKLAELIHSIREYIDLFSDLNAQAVQGKLACREMLRLTQEDGMKHRGAQEETYKKNIDTYQLFIADDLSRCFCQQVIFVYFYLMNRIGLIDTQKKTAEIFQVQHDFFHYLNVVCQSVTVNLENALVYTEEVMEEFACGGDKNERIT